MRIWAPVFLASCTAHVAPEQVDAVTRLRGDPAHGEVVYRERCEECHHADGVGKGADLPTLVPVSTPADLTLSVLMGPSIMPNFVHQASPQDVADVVAWLQQRWGKANPG